jgi:hypothetical protein
MDEHEFISCNWHKLDRSKSVYANLYFPNVVAVCDFYTQWQYIYLLQTKITVEQQANSTDTTEYMGMNSFVIC